MALARQQLEQQLVAAHRSGNVQAAQQAAYAIRQYDSRLASGSSMFDYSVPQPTINVSDLVVEKNDPSADPKTWGTRPDGSKKGQGFLGLLRRPDGGVSSEISIGVNMDGKEISLPLMVPTLTRDEVKALLALPQDENFNRNLPPSIKDKAITFARRRLAQGKSTFADSDESQPVRFAPPPIERVPKPTFGNWLENVSAGIGQTWTQNLENTAQAVKRGVTAFTEDPLKASAAAFMSVLEPARQGFTQPVQTAKDVGAGVVETGKEMYRDATSGPMGLGRTIGQFVDMPGPNLPGGKRKPTMAELDVYHGTPHTLPAEEGAPLGRFRSEKIGTGEGAQAYGYGLYFAESPGVAKDYQNVLASPRNMVADKRGVYIIPSPMGNGKYMLGTRSEIGKAVGTAGDAVQFIYTDNEFPNLASAIKFAKKKGILNKDERPRLSMIGEDGKYIPISKSSDVDSPEYEQFIASDPGSLYKVDLPDAKIEQMLDWDKPISQQPAMQKAFTKFWKGLSKDERAQAVYEEFGDYDLADQMAKSPGEVRGRLAYTLMTHHFGDQAAASDFLRQQGVPGIKYLDAGSRSGEKGTRNFVVFPGEEQNLTVLERNGQRAVAPKAVAPKVRQFAPTSLASVKVGGKVDEYTVRADVPNTDSIGATLDDYEVLSGIRSVPISDFDPEYVRSISMDKLDARTRRLADEIQKSKELSPMIVAYDAEGPYIIEGGHRFDALIASKAKNIPAVVVIDKSNPPKAAALVIDTTKPKREQLRQLHQQSGVSFVDATIDRGGAHTPAGPTSGSPAYDVSLNGTYPEDFYGANGLRYYGTGYDAMDTQAYNKLRRLEGNPNAAVEVYRAVEKNGPKTISPGDWVTTVRDYAKDHGESSLNGDYKIIKMLVNARDIYTAGDSMLEYGYHPQPRMPQLPKAAK